MTTSPEKIRRAIRYAANAKKNIADVAHVNFYLGSGEHISQADLDAHHAGAREIPPLRVSPAPVEVDDFGAPVEPFEPVETVEPARNDIAASNVIAEAEQLPAVLTVADARQAVTEGQIRLRVAVDKQAQCRQRLARAIGKWQAAIGNVLTDADLRRQHLAHEAEQRGLRAAGLIPPRGLGRTLQSRVDQIAAGTAGATHGKGPGFFAYKRPLIGAAPGTPGGGPAMSLASSQAALNRAAAMRKLPSER
jgi:hypothetical protein